MKTTLELQKIVSDLGIDPFRFLTWQEKELAYAGVNEYAEDEDHRETLAG